MITSGQVNAATQLWIPGRSQWAPANAFQELADALASATPPGTAYPHVDAPLGFPRSRQRRADASVPCVWLPRHHDKGMADVGHHLHDSVLPDRIAVLAHQALQVPSVRSPPELTSHPEGEAGGD